jgi:hypothetical protein
MALVGDGRTMHQPQRSGKRRRSCGCATFAFSRRCPWLCENQGESNQIKPAEGGWDCDYDYDQERSRMPAKYSPIQIPNQTQSNQIDPESSENMTILSEILMLRLVFFARKSADGSGLTGKKIALGFTRIKRF